MEETSFMKKSIAVWESEGGALSQRGFCFAGQAALGPGLLCERTPLAAPMTGTVNQIEWALQIRERVSAEFARVAKTLTSVAGKQAGQDRADTQAIIAILEEKRADVLARTKAGYFIHDWQELGDQVRRMIVQDPRYLAIRNNKTARHR